VCTENSRRAQDPPTWTLIPNKVSLSLALSLARARSLSLARSRSLSLSHPERVCSRPSLRQYCRPRGMSIQHKAAAEKCCDPRCCPAARSCLGPRRRRKVLRRHGAQSPWRRKWHGAMARRRAAARRAVARRAIFPSSVISTASRRASRGRPPA